MVAGFDVAAHTILLVVAGSRAFGVHTDASDVDVKGVAVPPRRFLHGLATFEQATAPEDLAAFHVELTPEEQAAAARSHLEGTVFDVRKFLRLLTEANPNLLDVLFCRDEEVRRCTPLGRRLRDSRRLFVTARCRHTFAGYATAQLKRIETHRRWLLHPPDHPPSRAAFDLPEHTPMPADQLAAANAAIKARMEEWDVDLGALEEPERLALQRRIADTLAEMAITQDDRWRGAGRAIGLDANFLLLLDRERRYRAARTAWEQYEHWKRTRNAARAAGEARFGYDVKHGAHLYRLLEMCKEILLTGEVNVWRGDRDADTIRAIRRGEWSYERLVGWAKDRDAELDDIYGRRAYVVPDAPDRAAIEELCVEIVEGAIAGS